MPAKRFYGQKALENPNKNNHTRQKSSKVISSRQHEHLLQEKRGTGDKRMEGSKQISQDLNYTHTRNPQIIQTTQLQAIIVNPQKTQ